MIFISEEKKKQYFFDWTINLHCQYDAKIYPHFVFILCKNNVLKIYYIIHNYSRISIS